MPIAIEALRDVGGRSKGDEGIWEVLKGGPHARTFRHAASCGSSTWLNSRWPSQSNAGKRMSR